MSSDRGPSPWTLYDENDPSTFPPREGRGEVYRGGGPITRDVVKAIHMTGVLRSEKNEGLVIADDGTPSGPERLWSILREHVDDINEVVDVLPDGLPLPDRLEGSDQWVVWRYL